MNNVDGVIEYKKRDRKAHVNIDATQMTAEEIHNKLDKGYQDAMVGRRHDAKEAFAAFRMEKK